MKNNTWFVGILIGLVLAISGWGIRQFEKTDDNLLVRVEALEKDNARQKAQFEEILNRLERIERGIDKVNAVNAPGRRAPEAN